MKFDVVQKHIKSAIIMTEDRDKWKDSWLLASLYLPWWPRE